MNILFIHWGKSGAGPTLLLEVFTAAARSEDSNVFVSTNLGAENYASYERSDSVLAVRTYRSKMQFLTRAYRVLTNGLTLRRYLSTKKINTVISLMESPYQSLALPFWKTGGIKYISVIHDARLHPGEDGLLPRLTRRFELFFADLIITLSSSQLFELERKIQKPILKMRLPVTGARTSSEVQQRDNHDSIRFLFFGRLQEYKGLKELIEAADIVYASGFQNFEIRIVGAGPMGFLAESHRREYLDWQVGWTTESDIEEVLSEGDVVVLPYQSGSQSGVVTYCQKLAIPILMTPIPGLLEQVSGSGGALVTDALSAESIAGGMRQVLSDRQMVEDLRGQLVEAKSKLYWASLWAEDLITVAIDSQHAK